MEVPNGTLNHEMPASVTQTKRLESNERKKEKPIKVPLQLTSSKSTASLLFNRSGYEEKMHLHSIYEHKFFDSLTKNRKSLEDVRLLKKLSTKRLENPQGCILTKRNSLALVPRGLFQRMKDSGSLPKRSPINLDTK